MDDFGQRPVGQRVRPVSPPPSRPQQAAPRPQGAPAAPVSPYQPAAGTPTPQPQRPVQSAHPAFPQTPRPTQSPSSVPPEPTTPFEPPKPPVAPKKPRQKPTKKKLIIWIISAIVGILLLTAGGIWLWYSNQLSPVDSTNTSKYLINIESGTTPTGIADVLKDKGVIKNQTAFLWYTRIEGVQNSLQAGTYRLSPSESTPEIVDHLTNGNVDTFDITFLPGSTLMENRKVFLDAGYSEDEVNVAFGKTYDSPLFDGKPTSSDLEGYIYGDTYKFGAGSSVETILEHIFEAYEKVVADNDLVAKFKAQGLSLYQGITLASIVQRESIGGDEANIAQVFYKRLSLDMPLGSDVTYQYIADKLGVARDINLDSPYNTRRYTGLPPGPIAVPGINALKGVANPAEGDYLYFLSGDDDVTYYGRTLQEHERNIVEHCKEKCQII